MKRAIFALLVVAAIFILTCGNDDPLEHPHSVAFYGDSQTGHEVHRSIVEGILALNPDMTFHTGDLVEDGYSEYDWRVFIKITCELRERMPFYPCLGNHERESPYYFKLFDLPGNEQWYYVDYFDTRFIALDTNVEFEVGSEQYEWFEKALQGCPYSRIITYFHHPPFSLVGYNPEIAKKVRDNLVPLFETYGVDMVFSGHDHTYQRFLVNGIYYIVTGGGGGELHDKRYDDPNCQVFIKAHHFCLLTIYERCMTLEVYSPDLELLDYVTIDK